MPTAEEVAASKAAQAAEGEARRAANTPTDSSGNRLPDPVTETVLDPAGPGEPDPALGGGNGEGDPAGGPSGRPKPIYMSPQDQQRMEMARRFKRDDKGVVPFNGDMTDQEMLYGEHGRVDDVQQEEPLPPTAEEVAREQAPAPQPEKKFTIKVRGQDVHLTEAELLERASKVEAADSYLSESRDLLDQARQIRKDNRERGPDDPHRPEDRNNTQDGLTDPSLSADPQHPEDELEGAIEEVRYGTDSKEAAEKLRKVIKKAAAEESDRAADDRQLRRLIGNDDAKSAKALKTFSEANPELANDPIAQQVIAGNLFAIQREELIAAGVKAETLPKDNNVLAQWHQNWRIHGHPVSNQEQMLEKAKDRFVKWKGVPQQAQPAPRKESPRVEVNVNRDQRRANLPNQPTRSAVPPTAQARQNQPAAPRSRSDVIANMRKSRGQIVA